MAKIVHEGAHKYKRALLGARRKNYVIYRCMIPGCTHFCPLDLMENRISLCWGCDEEVILSKYDVEKAQIRRPTCLKCKQEKKDRRERLKKLLAGGI